MPKLTREQVIEKVRKGKSLKGQDLSEINLSRANLYGANFSEVNLLWGKLWRAKLWKANLSGTFLMGANLRGAKLSGANLTGASVIGANLIDADLSEADIIGADLRMSKFRGADLTGANLTGAKVYGIWLANAKLDDIIWEWVDCSRNGDGSDKRFRRDRGFEDIVQALEPQIVVSSDAELDADLLAGISGLAKAMQALKARISNVGDTPAGGSAITLKADEKENLIPAVIVLFNALVKDGAIDLETLSQDMADLNKIVINDRPLMDLLKDTLWLIDTSQLHYGLLEKFRRGFTGMVAEIRGESVTIKRQGDRLHIDYRQSVDRLRIEDKSGGTGKEVVKAAATAIASGTVGGAIAKILEWLITH